MALRIGNPAPDFALTDQSGNLFRLADVRGKKNLVVVFYLLASTPT